MDTFVVVGGDAAGMSAASKAKRDDPNLEVIVLEKGEWASYGACGLPYYVKGEIQSLSDLVSVTPEEFREERDIDLRTGHEVTALDTDARTVTARSSGGTETVAYDRLLLATGAAPVVPSLPGVDREGVFTLGSMTDGEDLREFVARARSSGSLDQPDRGRACRYLEEDQPGRVGIVGGGYVGIEMAEALAANDLSVVLFQRGDRLLAPFSEATSDVVTEHLEDRGVTVHLESEATALPGTDCVEAVETVDDRVSVDAVLLGTGVSPRTALAAEAGIEIGPTGAIATDAYHETSEAAVYAAGDCAESMHAVTGEPTHAPLALTANRHGRAVGQTVAGTPTAGGPVAGTAALKAFDVEAARTGILDRARATDAGFDPVTETVEARSRAGYYPEGGTVTVTLTADDDSGRLLGASLVSEYGEGAVHRSHAAVAAIHEGATVGDLEAYDLAYAPPFNTTWDPVLTAAKVLGGRMAG